MTASCLSDAKVLLAVGASSELDVEVVSYGCWHEGVRGSRAFANHSIRGEGGPAYPVTLLRVGHGATIHKDGLTIYMAARVGAEQHQEWHDIPWVPQAS